MDPTTPQPGQRRGKVTVRVLLFLVLAIGAPLGWWARRAQLQRRAVKAIEAAHGSVIDADEIVARVQDDSLDVLVPGTLERLRSHEPPTDVRPSSVPDAGWRGWLGRTLEWDDVESPATVVALGRGPGDEFDPALLADLPRLERLNLTLKPLGDAGLVPVGKLHHLRALTIWQAGITDAGLVHLAGWTGLEDLGIARNGDKITDEGLRHLRPLRKLRTLEVGGPEITDAGLEHLHDLSNLKFLLLVDAPRVTAAGIAGLRRRLPNLAVTGGP